MTGNDSAVQIEETPDEAAQDKTDFSASASQQVDSAVSLQGSPVPSDNEEDETHSTVPKSAGRASIKSLKLEIKKLRDALRKRDERKAKSTGKMGRPRKSYTEVGRRQKSNLIKEAWKHLETTYGVESAPLILTKLCRDHISKEENLITEKLSAPDTLEILREAKMTVTQLRILKQQMAARGFRLPLASERAIKEWRGSHAGSEEPPESAAAEEFIEVVEVSEASSSDAALAPMRPTTTYLTPAFVNVNGYSTYTSEGAYYESL